MAEFDGLAERRVKADPAAAGQEKFGPCVRGLTCDDFFLSGCAAGAAVTRYPET